MTPERSSGKKTPEQMNEEFRTLCQGKSLEELEMLLQRLMITPSMEEDTKRREIIESVIAKKIQRQI